MTSVEIKNPALFPLQCGDNITFYVAFKFGMYKGTVVECGRYCMRVDVNGTHMYIKYSDMRCVCLVK